MKEQEMALKNLIFRTICGSKLYGTDTPESDEDYVGVFVEDPEYLIGLSKVEQVERSIKDKDESGKNTADARDETLYALKKFVKLAADNNPNIIELLFVNPSNLLHINDIGEELLSMKDAFVSKNIKHRFLGYAFSQKHKMVIKMDNYEMIEEALGCLLESDVDYLSDFGEHHPIIRRNKKQVRIGDVNFPANLTRKKAIQALEKRRGKFGHRRDLISKYGLDTKFASHLVRLLYEGIDLLRHGKLEFPLPQVDIIMDVKKGNVPVGKVLDMAEKLETIAEEMYEKTKLPHSPDRKRIEEFLMKTYRRIICQ